MTYEKSLFELYPLNNKISYCCFLLENSLLCDQGSAGKESCSYVTFHI